MIPEDFFFLCFWEEFFTGTWFWRGSQKCLFLDAVTGFFRRNSCGQEFLFLLWTPLDSSRFLQIPPDSSRFLFLQKAVWLRPATKEGSLLRKIWTKIDHFQPLSRTGLDHGVRCPCPLLAPTGLKVRPATVAEVVIAEEAALMVMVEALADVALAMTIATADAEKH